MSGKSKATELGTLCKWKPGQYEKQRERLARITSAPECYCRNCGRVAAKKKWLCKPERLRDEE